MKCYKPYVNDSSVHRSKIEKKKFFKQTHKYTQLSLPVQRQNKDDKVIQLRHAQYCVTIAAVANTNIHHILPIKVDEVLSLEFVRYIECMSSYIDGWAYNVLEFQALSLRAGYYRSQDMYYFQSTLS